MSKILMYCAPWHIGKSASARDIFVDPLQSYLDIEIKVWDESNNIPPERPDATNIVFWQVEPPPLWLEGLSGRIVWVPMWDAVEGFPLDYWLTLPKDLRIVSFSRNLTCRTEAAGLRTFSCQYFSDPSTCPEARWEHERVAFYWNRRGLFDVNFLQRFCAVARVDRLLYRDDVDPIVGADACRGTLPERLGRTQVETVPWLESRSEYSHYLNRAHIFIAPRAAEGVGIAFLEAMARGCAVIAFDAPTMNEYIDSGKNGVLIPNFGGNWLERMNARFLRKALTILASLRKKPAPRWTLVSETQDWRQLARLDYPEMGRRARKDHVAGFVRWQESIESLAQFVTCG